MLALFQRLVNKHSRPVHQRGQEYRSVSYSPLRPWQVRGRQFRITRHGLDPTEVNAFLDRVATDLASAYARLASSEEEALQIKNALREWQTRQAPRMHELARR